MLFTCHKTPASGNEDDSESPCLGGYRAPRTMRGCTPAAVPGGGLRPSPPVGRGPRPARGVPGQGWEDW